MGNNKSLLEGVAWDRREKVMREEKNRWKTDHRSCHKRPEPVFLKQNSCGLHYMDGKIHFLFRCGRTESPCMFGCYELPSFSSQSTFMSTVCQSQVPQARPQSYPKERTAVCLSASEWSICACQQFKASETVSHEVYLCHCCPKS